MLVSMVTELSLTKRLGDPFLSNQPTPITFMCVYIYIYFFLPQLDILLLLLLSHKS